ncbi:hypothetical protein ABW21_db0200462 [Orbilia brochopaga]|nr:hypothetical protein ABW21_db0200462 [Drechslerella brochopaga]
MGIAPNAKLVVTHPLTGRRNQNISSWLNRYLKIYDHIVNNKKLMGGNWNGAVITVSAGQPRQLNVRSAAKKAGRFSFEFYVAQMLQLELEIVKLFKDLGAYFVVTAGNGPPVGFSVLYMSIDRLYRGSS